MLKQLIALLILFSISSASTVLGQFPVDSKKGNLPYFDIRDLNAAGPLATAIVAQRQTNLASFVGQPEEIRLGTRIVSNEFGLPKLYLRDGHSVTSPSGLKPSEIAKEFLRA